MAVCYSSIAPKVEKEIGEKEIEDSQELLRIILKVYQLFISYDLKKKNLCTISFVLPRSRKLHYCTTVFIGICYSEIFNSYSS